MSFAIKWGSFDSIEMLGKTFGQDHQLTVISVFLNDKNRKFCILECSKCSKDHELFPEFYFKIEKYALLQGKLPCGCSKNCKWSKEQHFVRCTRKASENGYRFEGFYGEWKGDKTKITLCCEKHGSWTTGNINHLFNGKGCPSCKADVTRNFNRETKRKSEEDVVPSFFASGAFHPDTKFWRDTEPDKDGHCKRWKMFCPICKSESRPAAPRELSKGHMPCNCSTNKKSYAYINLLKDGETYVGIKFGITNDYKARMVQQKKNTSYDIELYGLYKFQDIKSCKEAEKVCKDILDCGVVSRNDMQDGYTETVKIYDLEKVVDIYTKFGGVLYEHGY